MFTSPVALRSPLSRVRKKHLPIPEEDFVDISPDEATQYFENVNYPASKDDLASAAEDNGAPEELLERLRTLGRPSFSDQDEVVAELESSPTSG
jgi:hypothetical protein